LTPESAGFDDGLRELPGLVVVAIGADVIEIDRVRDVVTRQPGFVTRVYTSDEIEYCQKHRDPAERFAVRFAAKEAVLKTLGVGLGGADLTDIEVIRTASGKPELAISGRAEPLAVSLGIVKWLITLSHSDTVAQAFVAGLGPQPKL